MMTIHINCPCTKDCLHRSCNCRALCWEFQEYEKQRRASYAERDKERRKERALSKYGSPSYRHYQYLKKREDQHR